MEKKFDAIILGAGIAGLSAAERLLRYGVDNFVVLEARNRTGNVSPVFLRHFVNVSFFSGTSKLLSFFKGEKLK
jgi:thioredoxin reductase